MALFCFANFPDSTVHGANMGPIWGRHGPGWPNVGPMYFAIWEIDMALKYFSVENTFPVLRYGMIVFEINNGHV